MTKTVKLLDCTLRDGGYVNNWLFGNGTMTCIYDRLNEAGVDIVEIGFLDDREPFDISRSIQPDTQSLRKVYSKTMVKSSMILAMIDYGTCSIDHIQPQEETILDGIRVIFKKEKMCDAVDFGKQIIEKGYNLFLQLVSITDYQEEDIIKLAKLVNSIHPFAVSIVDTYGLMHEEQVHTYFSWLDRYLDSGISIGYHSHNNFQLAYSNTLEIINMETTRDIVVDGTLYGMGKSAGNAPLELLAMYLNDNCGKSYDINQILEAINSEILPIYEEHYWGYNLFFYIAARNKCHPNYVKYLMNKKTLSLKDVNVILGKIEDAYKLRYKEDYIEAIYGEYVLDNIDDTECVDALKQILADKKILVLGPGKSVLKSVSEIKEYIHNHHPLVISTNFVPNDVEINAVFISNPLRYNLIIPKIIDSKVVVIGTSNVTPVGRQFDYTVRYDLLIARNTIWDNSLAILLNLFKKIGTTDVALAGFDGFKEDMVENYVDPDFDLSRSYEYLQMVNACMTTMIKDIRKTMKVTFVTDSLYDNTE